VISLQGREVNRVPIATIRQVVVFGNVQVSTQALHTLAEAEIPVSYLSGYGKFIAAFVAPPAKNMALRTAQYRTFSDPERALALSRAIVAAKIANQRTLLMRSLRSLREGEPQCEPPPGETFGPADGRVQETRAQRTASGDDPAVSASSATPREISGGSPDHPPTDPSEPAPEPAANGPADRIRGRDEPAVRDVADLLARVPNAPDPGVLLGLEGQAAALYFGNFGRMLKARSPGAAFDFTARNRQPPRDPVNCLLSFAYAILAKDCFSAACTVGFDPYHGFYHVGRHGRPSLALDLMEEFRPVIADSVVLNLISNGMLTDRDFLTWRDACQLTDDGRATFFKAYEQRKATEVTHPVFGYRMSYGRMIEVQMRMLAAHVRGELPHYVGFTVR
jgi:CRISPR-associated protein Cas1